MEFFNETVVLIVAYFFLALSQTSISGFINSNGIIQVGDPTLEYVISQYLIYVIMFQVLVNLLNIMLKSVSDCKKDCRKKNIKRKIKRDFLTKYSHVFDIKNTAKMNPFIKIKTKPLKKEN